MLVVMCGLPAAGKSTLADDLGRRLGWPVLAVDPVEVAIVGAGVQPPATTGLAAYVVVGAVADHLLRLGLNVVVDAVNDAVEARRQWQELAGWHHLEPLWIEVICSEPQTHRARLEARPPADHRRDPRWSDLEPRRALLTDWLDDRMVVDSCEDHDRNLEAALARIADAESSAPG